VIAAAPLKAEVTRQQPRHPAEIAIIDRLIEPVEELALAAAW